MAALFPRLMLVLVFLFLLALPALLGLVPGIDAHQARQLLMRCAAAGAFLGGLLALASLGVARPATFGVAWLEFVARGAAGGGALGLLLLLGRRFRRA